MGHKHIGEESEVMLRIKAQANAVRIIIGFGLLFLSGGLSLLIWKIFG
jgi:hypothetical protein